MRSHRVRALLMGGQACVFYGGAEFSRDTDLAGVNEAIGRALAAATATPVTLFTSKKVITKDATLMGSRGGSRHRVRGECV